MSYPSQKRRLRPARGIAALVAALMAGGAGLATLPSAQAVPSPSGPAGMIQTMGGVTRNYVQGGYGPEGAPATESQFSNPRGLGFGPNGEIYVADSLNHRIRKIDQNGIVTHIAGNGTAGGWDATQDGADATSITLNEPHGVAADSAGNVYIADSKNCIIRKVDTAGKISRVAGTSAKKLENGACIGGSGDAEGPALSIALDQPKAIFMAREGNADFLYVTDKGNNQIRKIDVADPNGTKGSVRVAGNSQARRFGGDGGDARSAQLRHATGVWVANDGTMYISDSGNNLVRKVAMPTSPTSSVRIITTIAGDVAYANQRAMEGDSAVGGDQLPGKSSGDGGLAINASIDGPRGIAGDNKGNLFIAEENGARIRRIRLNAPGGPTIDTIAGDGISVLQRGQGGDAAIKGENGPALETQFAYLHDIQINPVDGSLWIADSRNNRVRAIADAANAPGANVPAGGHPTTTTTAPGNNNPVPVPGKSGYWMLGVDGKVFAFGDATQAMFGDAVGRIPAGAKAVHIEPTPSGRGYWINDDRGGVYYFGDAADKGGIAASELQPGEKIVSLSATPSGQGYWLFSTKGRVFTKGDAGNFGGLGHLTLNGPVQSSIPTPTGKGYYMVGSDGGVFAFGDAKFHGSTGNLRLNKPVMSLVPTRTGQGYWLVASDGGIFAFGDAVFKGSMGDKRLNQPVVGMVRYGSGYLMVAADGGIFSFSEKGFAGSLGANPPAKPISFAATLDS
jgi:sugar lactone lactonase YvrE